MTMNIRVLGTLCLIGNGIWVLDSIRWFFRGFGWDTIDVVVSIICAIGSICGILGLIALKATGPHPILRPLSYLPILGFLFTIAITFGNNQDVVSQLIAFFIQAGGMALVTILTLITKSWAGWRKLTPLLTVLAWPIGWAAQSLLGNPAGLGNLIMGAAWVLLGYAILSSPPATPTASTRTAMA
jgi:hypothetical protein